MAKAEIKSTSDTWNVAEGYVKLKILAPLVECDKLITVSLYGAENIEDSSMLDNYSKSSYRIEAINRLLDKLRIIIENTNFCLKSKSKKTIEKLDKDLDKVKKVIAGIEKKSSNSIDHTNTTDIDEDHFHLCLKHLRQIKKEITEPLNENSLIFPSSEEIDLNQIKKELIEGG